MSSWPPPDRGRSTCKPTAGLRRAPRRSWFSREGPAARRRSPATHGTTTPTANQPFSGTITGTGFSRPSSVWFCPSSGSCQQLAASQVTLNSATSISVSNVILASRIVAGLRANQRRAFGALHAVRWFSRGRAAGRRSPAMPGTPRRQPISPSAGRSRGRGSTHPSWCGSAPVPGSCQQLAASQVTLNSATSVSVTSVTLTAGSWQLYVQTNGGPSGRSTTFMVQAPPGAPAISNLAVQVRAQGYSGRP